MQGMKLKACVRSFYSDRFKNAFQNIPILWIYLIKSSTSILMSRFVSISALIL